MPKVDKPDKPREDFPLYAHRTGRWAKKVRGKTEYFGPWDDPQTALEKWLRDKDYLLAGQRPPDKQGGLTVARLCDVFYDAKQRLRNIDQLEPRTLIDYDRTNKRIVRVFGRNRSVESLTPTDFANLRDDMARTLGPVAMRNEMVRVRVVMKYAKTNGLIASSAEYGDEFKRPPKRAVRIAKRKRNIKFFESQEIRLLLNNAGVQMKAMILLAINGGFGNQDCGTLPINSIDLEKGWVTWYRPKTGIERRFPLWPVTVTAVNAVLEKRNEPKNVEHNGLLFITKYGLSWSKETTTNPVSAEFRKLAIDVGVHRMGVGFYALRHTFKTIADRSRDRAAVEYIMGHVNDSIEMDYVEGIDDSRLEDVVEKVRSWLFIDNCPISLKRSRCSPL